MPASGDLLFGKIAVTQRFCSQSQLDECARLQLQLQSPHQPAPKLGEILLDKGYLTREQSGKILELQRQSLDSVDPMVQKRKEAVLFGKLAVREGLATAEEVNECLALQAQPAEKRSLGEILVEKNYLTAIQVKQLLSRQLKKIMACATCRLSFTVLTLSQGKRIDCPRCKLPLHEGKLSDSTRTDAEFATQVLRAVKEGVPAPKPDSRVILPKASKIKITCVICDAVFEAPLDTTGRARCPQCHTTFTPK